MGLSNDLISQFVKATKDTPKQSKETTAYGTITIGTDGKEYVQLDGSGVTTPVSSTVSVKEGDRVIVMIKNHTATVTGNLDDRAVRTGEVKDQTDAITRVDTLLAEEIDARKANFDTLSTDNATIRGYLFANNADIDALMARKATIYGLLTASEANIDDLEAAVLNVKVGNIEYLNVTEALTATHATLYDLKGTYAKFVNSTSENFESVNATIDNLGTKYANIDFANIGEAAVRNLYSKSGFIKDLTVKDGVFTGELTGVTISGDLIKADTLMANALIIQGKDGLYYRLNAGVDGVTETQLASEEYQTKLHGSNIIAKTIVAEDINVSDLKAFGATIGGFKISEDSIYSGVKTSIDNTTQGIYLGSDGQVHIGDDRSYIQYYKHADGNWYVDIAATNIVFATTGMNVETAFDNLSVKVNNQKIGSTNILRNTDNVGAFSLTSSWAKGTWRTAGGGTTGGRTVIDIVDAPNPYIKKGFRIVGDDTDRATSQDNVPVAAGLTYTMSCYARGTGTLRLQVGKSPYSAGVYGLSNVMAWRKYSFTFVAGDGNGITDGKTNVYFTNRGTGTMEICGFKLEVGNSATDWSPSPYTDYMNFSSSGLVIGDMTSGTLGSNVLIDSDSVDIRNGSATYASFGANYLYLAKNSRNAKIDLCNGLATLYHESKYSYDTVFIIDTGNTTELISNTSTPLCITSGNTDFPKVSVQFAIGNEIVGGLGIVKSTSTDNVLVRMGKNMVNSYTVLDTGNYYSVMDSGWRAGGVIGEKFTLYDNDYQIQYRKIGKMVEIRGVIKPVTTITGSTTNYDIFTLGEGYRPSKYLYERCQGSGGYSWLLSITTGGVVRFARYTDGSKWVDATIDTWLPFHVTFFVD